jgi:hypothetical protein
MGGKDKNFGVSMLLSQDIEKTKFHLVRFFLYTLYIKEMNKDSTFGPRVPEQSFTGEEGVICLCLTLANI